ncbi:hypothetical protein BH20ACI3_BH20ACI3_37370 [soil metagenome]
MRKLNQIGPAIMFAGIGLMFGFGGSFSKVNILAASAAEIQPSQALTSCDLLFEFQPRMNADNAKKKKRSFNWLVRSNF